MPHTQLPADFWQVVIAFSVSAISATVSITRRIVMGHEARWLWIFSEFVTAILCGYLMFNAYPVVAPFLPDWVTLPIAVAFVAHSGGRVFQEAETIILQHYKIFTNKTPK